MSEFHLSPKADRTVRPLEMHSPNIASLSRIDGELSPKAPRAVIRSGLPRMPAVDVDDENIESHWLSPIGRGGLDFGTPMNVSETSILGARGAEAEERYCNNHDGARMNDGDNQLMDSSFPDGRDDVEFDISQQQEGVDDEEEEYDGFGEEIEDVEESEEERMMREMEESEALARQLMAEEAMASYAMSTEYLRENADQFSGEDLAALQAAMAEEDPDLDPELEDDDHRDDEEGSANGGDSYDALLLLGERIGSVKEERWALIAHEKTNERCPTLCFTNSMAEGKEENHTEVKCQVCQFPYEDGEQLRRLPCGHCFHAECIERWLETKDTCALCRKSIVDDATEE